MSIKGEDSFCNLRKPSQLYQCLVHNIHLGLKSAISTDESTSMMECFTHQV
jgi:hypothetical protein